MRTYEPGETPKRVPQPGDPDYVPPAQAPPLAPEPTQTAEGVTKNSPIPGVDPFRLAQASDAYNRALASVNSRRASTMTTYGFKASGYDDTGNATGLEVDPNSMYGSYQQMLDAQARESMAAEDEGAGRGFSGGLANRAEGALKYSQGAQRLQLGQGLLGGLGSLNQELLSAKKAYDDELYNARLDAARRAADAQQYTPVQYTPETSAPPPPDTTNVPHDLPLVKPTTPKTVAKAQVLAKKVAANKTGATYIKGRGVISIH